MGNLRIIIFTLVLLAIMATAQSLTKESLALPGASAILALGFTLMIAYLFGKIINNFHLPKITGYLLAGILTGPYFIDLLSANVVKELQLIDNIALAIIALTAGGELRLSKLKTQARLLSKMMLWLIVIVMALTVVAVMLSKPFFPFLREQSFLATLGIGLIFGVLSISASPATTIAIITETRAKGNFTDLMLSLVIAIDLLVVLLFAVVIALARPMIMPQQAIEFSYIVTVFSEIFVSLIVGGFAGFLIYLYLRYVNAQIFLFLIGFILLIIELRYILHLEIILVFITAGFIVQNFSRHGEQLIHTIEKSSLAIYVIFFAIAGAALNFRIFIDNWLFTLIIVGSRLLAMYGGTYRGSRIPEGNRIFRQYSWMGLAGQAGITLGLAIIVERSLPGDLGNFIRSILVAGIAMNQILGPILFRFSLEKAGEISDN